MSKTFFKISCALLVLIVGVGSSQTTTARRQGSGLGGFSLNRFAHNDTETETKPDIPERKYAPDRKVDIIHVIIDLTPDFKARTITGTTTIEFVPIAKPLIELRLDAIDLAVSSVTSSAPIAGYSVTDEAITITFAPALEPGADTTTSRSGKYSSITSNRNLTATGWLWAR